MKIVPYNPNLHYNDICLLIDNHNDGRLLTTSRDYFTNRNSSFTGFVALIDDEVVGFTGISNDKSITVVHQKHRRCNIGTELLRVKLPYINYTETGATNIGMIKALLKLNFQLVDVGVRSNGAVYLKFKKEVTLYE